MSPFGLHWDELDEDISVQGFLRGDPTRPGNAKQYPESLKMNALSAQI
jgi:hypothetical protein